MSSVEIATNPFLGVIDNNDYRTPIDLINKTIATNLSAVFGYKTYSQDDLLYSNLQSQVNFFQEIDIRSGAGLAPLGYVSATSTGATSVHKPVGIVTPGYGLPYFASSLTETKNNFLFNVAALSYQDKQNKLGSDYITPLSIAKQLGFNVITPVSKKELELTSLLAVALATLSNSNSTIHLFDGLTSTRSFSTLNSNIDNSESLIANLAKTLGNEPSFDAILKGFNEQAGSQLTKFQYSGPSNPEVLFVTYGTTESELFGSVLPTLSVRVPLPFDTNEFVNSIPSSVKKIVIIGQSLNENHAVPSSLRLDVSSALFFHGRKNISIQEHIYQPDFVWTTREVSNIANQFDVKTVSATAQRGKHALFYLPDDSKFINIPATLVKILASTTNDIQFSTKFNNSVHSGTFEADIAVGNIETGAASADFILVQDINLLNHLDIVNAIKENGTIVYLADRDITKYPQQFIADLITKKITLVIVDPTEYEDDIDSLVALIQGQFYQSGLQLANSQIQSKIVSNLSQEQIHDILNANEDSEEYQFSIFTDSSLPKPEFSEEVREQLPSFFQADSFKPNNIKQQQAIVNDPPSITSTITELTKRLAFKEAYHVEKKLRPDLPLIKNHVIKVKENRRLTPVDYDRNIFHIEFDISGTDLTYDIGEALGIHARNNEQQVLEFLQSYGLDPEQIVQVPNKDQPQYIESRTVLQVFVENLDLFGKPPKKFYESLIPFAKDEDEKKFLQDLITPGGALELKNFQEVEFYSYADIFARFPSVRPGLADLINIIAPLKRREYSIASSQKMHPNEIHLLIVVVDWVDKQGRKRYGQASKYISDLKIGQELVVSVKPSVMKLPADPKAPVIMSGLGTGLAPFKAIVEEKLWQKQQGLEIGDIFLYLGSRHCRQEYLYGEVWEAYKDAGIITHIGAAFSRDQTQKIYIQDRIRENLDDLKVAMIDQKGSFFLCGPTWPVPDITSALEDIIAADAKERKVKVDLNEAIEELKETSRYILEVY
ncbi:hypothetical protein C6P45_002419 [Maudiozyma exigua]|uniref:assimilatory sulfite reductase (NADPH) n=1 Tax=Maudiozyma exigua TaxID=34358 RepID=A0A9P6VYA9_MAUEX|nr:hypothetical protein C6P45_002419 [Kazachstania exigua]